jgi:hypothetical protein
VAAIGHRGRARTSRLTPLILWMSSSRKHLAQGLLALLGLAALIVPTASFAGIPTQAQSGTELVFAGDTAQSGGGQLAVPVECLGESSGFCSGVLTLSRGGERQTVPFSVEGGDREALFVPFHAAGQGHGWKVHAVATTTQRLGPPSSHETYLLAR